MRILVKVSLGHMMGNKEVEIDVDDESTDAEIEETAREALFERLITWDWKRVDAPTKAKKR